MSLETNSRGRQRPERLWSLWDQAASASPSPHSSGLWGHKQWGKRQPVRNSIKSPLVRCELIILIHSEAGFHRQDISSLISTFGAGRDAPRCLQHMCSPHSTPALLCVHCLTTCSTAPTPHTPQSLPSCKPTACCPSHLLSLETVRREVRAHQVATMWDGRNRKWLWATAGTGDRRCIAIAVRNLRCLTKKKEITVARACHGLPAHLPSPRSDLSLVSAWAFSALCDGNCLPLPAHCEEVTAIEITSL